MDNMPQEHVWRLHDLCPCGSGNHNICVNSGCSASYGCGAPNAVYGEKDKGYNEPCPWSPEKAKSLKIPSTPTHIMATTLYDYWLGHSVSLDEAKSVENHLRQCQECRSRIEQLSERLPN